ncbi:MAG TPA: siderophore-interacting protein [Candidatus Dormibacteraeota bacterium]|nr:siderophore-interacting protein [Candidatus Dormibacteraeota bacterium]
MLPEPRTWHLEVAAVQDVTPRMRRVQLTSPTLDAFDYLQGQDLALVFRRGADPTVRRRYTIRRFDRGRRLLELEFVMHGDGPGMRRAQAAQPGSTIETVGPRGKITLASGADWHLFAGDATALPGAFAMMEAVAASVPALAFLRVDGPQERQPLPNDRPDRDVSWWYEWPNPAEGDGLVAALAAAELPGGRGHAYLAGEVALVTALKATLESGGWTTDQISAKAYWNRGRANAGHGEPELKAS